MNSCCLKGFCFTTCHTFKIQFLFPDDKIVHCSGIHWPQKDGMWQSLCHIPFQSQFQSKDVLQWHREEVLGRWVVHYINLCSRSIGEHPGSRLGETPTEDWTVHRYDAINTFTPAVIVNNNSCIPCGTFSTSYTYILYIYIYFLFYLFFTVVLPLQKNKSVLHLCRVFS